MSITVKNLTKIYGAQKAVDSVSFSVGQGEIVGFLGPNGAGKSTTFKIITGYLQADSGRVEVCGVPVSENSRYTKSRIGYLPEANPLYPDMYVREYLEFIAGIHHVKPAVPRIAHAMDTVGMMPEAGKKTGQLSKGYKQRLGLAAALIHDPEVLILDEPTSGLDPNQIAEIREVIKKMGALKTILFSSHILQEVEAICDRVIIINRGEIVADDTLSRLFKGAPEHHQVIVRFRENIPAERLKGLVNATSVENTQTGSGDQGQSAFKITTGSPDELRKQLMELSLQNDWNIVSLQSETNSLEDVFRNLTI